MEGPTSPWGLRNRITRLTLRDHDDDDDEQKHTKHTTKAYKTYNLIQNDEECNQKNMKECDKRKSHISSELHMIYISSNDVRHLTKIHKHLGLYLLQYSSKQQDDLSRSRDES
jgi:hypothetical protein